MVYLNFGVVGFLGLIQILRLLQRLPSGHMHGTKGKPTWYFAMGTWKRQPSNYCLRTRTTQLWPDGIETICLTVKLAVHENVRFSSGAVCPSEYAASL